MNGAFHRMNGKTGMAGNPAKPKDSKKTA